MSLIVREQTNGTRYGRAPLGKTQKTVLLVLELHHGGLSARGLSINHRTLTEAAARSALASLGDRKLVAPVGWDERRRTFDLTEDGWRAVRRLRGR